MSTGLSHQAVPAFFAGRDGQYIQPLSLRGRVNLGDVTARELHERGGAATRGERLHEYGRAGRLRFLQRVGEILHLVAGQLVPERIRQMAIGHQDLHVAEC